MHQTYLPCSCLIYSIISRSSGCDEGRNCSGSFQLPPAFISGTNDADLRPFLAMGRRSQRNKNASAKMAAHVAAGLAPWTRTAGFIANRLKELEAELQASQTQLGSDAAASQREQRMQAQIEELEQHNVRYRLAAAEEMAGLQLDELQLEELQQQLEEQQQHVEEQQQHLEEQQQQVEEQQRQVLAAASKAVYAAEQRAAMAACTAHALALLLGLLQHANAVMVEEAVALHQCVEDRVPCGMTLRQAMDDICHQAHKHQSGDHDAVHQCAKLIECLKAAGYWTADVKIVFAVCDSAASNVGKHSGVVMRLAAAKIKAGHQVHTIWVVHCWEHVLHNSVRHLCQAYGCSAQMQREGHNSQFCWMLEHVSTHFKKHPLAEALQVELACLTRWGTYGRIAVWILQHYATLLVQLQKYNTPDITAGQQKTVQCLLSNLLDVKIMVHCAVLAALDRAVLQHEQLWAQSNSSRWMCHWHSHHHNVMLELMAAVKQPRRVLAEAYD
ncbi:hypothetical protein QJQ45_016803, partial [Haematococcus lacustris]